MIIMILAMPINRRELLVEFCSWGLSVTCCKSFAVTFYPHLQINRGQFSAQYHGFTSGITSNSENHNEVEDGG